MLNNIKITDISKTKKGFNALFSENEFLFSVDDMILTKEKIAIGSCFTQQELNCILKQSQTAKAIDKAYNLLSFRSHGKKELYNKLLRTFDKDCAQQAVDKIEELGFINDEHFAYLKAEYLINVKKASLSHTKLELQRLGIDKDIIDSVLLEFDIDNQVPTIVQLINTKYKSKLNQPEKIIQSLARKGFSYSDIKQALLESTINVEDIQEF